MLIYICVTKYLMEKALFKKEYIEDVFSSKYLNEKGYSLAFKLNNDELQKIREYIYDQWIYRIQLLDKNLLKFIKKSNNIRRLSSNFFKNRSFKDLE